MSQRANCPGEIRGRVWRADEVAVFDSSVPGQTHGLSWWPFKNSDKKKEHKEALLDGGEEKHGSSPLHDGVSLWVWARVEADGKFDVWIRGFKISAHRYAALFGNEILNRLNTAGGFTDVSVEWKPDCESGRDNEIAISGTHSPALSPREIAFEVLGVPNPGGAGDAITPRVEAIRHTWNVVEHSSNSWQLYHA